MDDDQLIRQFMQARREDISDNGFSDRVMRHIPFERPFWTYIASALFILTALAALLIWFDGWSVLCSIFVHIYTAIAYVKHMAFEPLYLLVFIALGGWLAIEKIKQLVYRI